MELIITVFATLIAVACSIVLIARARNNSDRKNTATENTADEDGK